MAVFISTTYFGDLSNVKVVLEELENLGIKNVEIGSNHAPINIEDLVLRHDTNYICHNYFPPPEEEFVLNIASEGTAVREKSVSFIKNTISICQKLGIKFYTVHPGFFADAISPHRNGSKSRNFDFVFKPISLNREKILKRTINIIRDIYTFSIDKGVQILIENQGSKTAKSFTLFDSPEELDLLKKEVGENLKFNFNLAHATLAGFGLDNEEVFSHFWQNSPFFEVSEIQDNLDSHLPLRPNVGMIASLIKKFSGSFAKKNIILEYRNIKSKELIKSYQFVQSLLKS